MGAEGNKKWVVSMYCADGTHVITRSKKERAIKYIEDQYGEGLDINHVNKELGLKGYFMCVDNGGRTYEMVYTELKTCKVCNKKDVPVYNITINPEWHKVPEKYNIKVCANCGNAFEVGFWTVVYSGGKYKVEHLC